MEVGQPKLSERVKELGCLLQGCIGAMYVDKLEGKISEGFFTCKSKEQVEKREPAGSLFIWFILSTYSACF
jgi:hypothetical protein